MLPRINPFFLLLPKGCSKALRGCQDAPNPPAWLTKPFEVASAHLWSYGLPSPSGVLPSSHTDLFAISLSSAVALLRIFTLIAFSVTNALCLCWTDSYSSVLPQHSLPCLLEALLSLGSLDLGSFPCSLPAPCVFHILSHCVFLFSWPSPFLETGRLKASEAGTNIRIHA